MRDGAAEEQKPDTEAALYAGAIATCVVALMPYVNVLIFPCYVIGAVGCCLVCSL